jgi:hypothetical protein
VLAQNRLLPRLNRQYQHPRFPLPASHFPLLPNPGQSNRHPLRDASLMSAGSTSRLSLELGGAA